MVGKTLRLVGMILLGFTAVITLLGGIGTTCVALDATKYEGMEAIAAYQWLYLLYVLAGIGLGILGIRATVLLAKARPQGYRLAVAVLLGGLVIGVLHMATSRALRGSSMPKDFIVYATALTLVIFLLFRVPGIRERINLTGGGSQIAGMGGAASLFVAGLTVLTVRWWAGPTHSIGGVNYVDVYALELAILGAALLAAGLSAWAFPWRKRMVKETRFLAETDAAP